MFVAMLIFLCTEVGSDNHMLVLPKSGLTVVLVALCDGTKGAGHPGAIFFAHAGSGMTHPFEQ